MLVCLLITNTARANHFTNKKLTNQQKTFLKAEKALKKGSMKTYYKLKGQLKNYELYPYLEYKEFIKNINKVSRKEYKELTKKYANSTIKGDFYRAWIGNKIKRKQWNAFLDSYIPSERDSKAQQCNYLYAMTLKGKTKEIYPQVINLWLHGRSLPKDCNPLISSWKQKKLINRPAVWQRIKLAIQANNLRLAQYLSQMLNKDERHYVSLWINVHRKPHTVKNKKLFNGKHPAIVEILTYGITKIAKNDVKEATKIWQEISKTHNFTDRHWSTMVREIGLSLAFSKHPDAYNWLNKVPEKYSNDTVLEWKIRSALARHNWDLVMKSINQLPTRLFEDEKWQYWLARSLEIKGYKTKSKNIYNKLAVNRSYYGFLSSKRLNKKPTLKHSTLAISNNEINKLYKYNSIKRAKELIALKRIYHAKKEWNYAILNDFNENERQAAAKLASMWNLPNWSITTLSKATNKNDLTLRFPKLYSKYMSKEAKNNRLDLAMLYAITRQESAFVSGAKSSAGALGLMQVMPSTAKMVAKKSKIRLSSNKQLLKPSMNIKLGSKYFRLMLDQYSNNSVMAMASYNAGPNNVKRWIPSQKMAADTWIETIPFIETRNYIQNILTYTVIYQDLLGRKSNLIKHMQPINGKN